MTVDPGKRPARTERLSDEVWRELCGLGVERHFRAGSTLLRQGEAGTYLLALTQGLVKVIRREENGETTLLAFRGPGDLLGEVAVFDLQKRIADVVALRPCRAVRLEAETFRTYVERRGMVMALMRQTLARLRESDMRLAELQRLPVLTRLARTLVRLADLTGPVPPGTAEWGLTGLTQEEIAQAIGVTRNAVVTGLQELRQTGAVETGRRVIEIRDMEALRVWAKTEHVEGM
ncbi:MULTISPECIES: Crp/Fnr family transcriptional regulator [unclassified Streptomyces]|uniref:Crp/Fnr family transcriptional regulator n=1 Tax=unclassified Streptomyces TaxID=2593676 RepID=UPI0036AFE887